MLEDTKGVTRTRISKKDRQHDGQKVKDLMTNNYLQNTTQKIQDRATGEELRCAGKVTSFCSTSDIRRVTLVTKPVISHGREKDR